MTLSVVIPVYNVGEFADKCVCSCRIQDVSKSDYEIIIVNDGTKYNNLEVLNHAVKGSGKLKVYLV